MAQVHMTEAEVSGDFAGVMRRLGSVEEVVIDRDGVPVAFIRAAEPPPLTLSELIARADRREKERGYAVVADDSYANDVERIVRERKPWTPRSWA